MQLLRFFFVLVLFAAPALAQPADPAHRLVQHGLEAMGGASQLQALESVRFNALAHRNLLEQSERPDGPWIPSYEAITELTSLTRQAQRVHTDNRFWGFASTLVVNDTVAAQVFGERAAPGTMAHVHAAQERFELGPERVLLTALAAPDLRYDRQDVLHDVPHHVVSFTWRDVPATLFLNADTGLPTAVEITRAYPHDLFWNLWGDVTTRTYFSFWSLEDGGIYYPLQWDIVRNDQPFRTVLITDLTLHASAPADSFAIVDDVRAGFSQRADVTADDRPLGRPDRPAQELAPGLIHIPGAWDIALVQQEDGVVVLEAPISSGYSETVLAEAARRFPDMPVKGVITTSDAWPHLAGVRTYVAKAVPVYALDRNIAQLTRLIQAPHHQHPDALSRTPRAPDFHVVSDRAVVGVGDNRFELYPVRGESGERMMIAYFPAHRLLYASDLIQYQRDGSLWQPAYASEVAAVIEREGLDVETVFALHTDARPWTDVLQQIDEAVAAP